MDWEQPGAVRATTRSGYVISCNVIGPGRNQNIDLTAKGLTRGVWGDEELSLSFPAPWLLRLLSGGLARRLIRFSLLWEMDASSSRWLSQFQVYPYPQKQLSSADISFGSRYRARADKIAQTLVCSQIRQFHITFGRFISNHREKNAPFLDIKKPSSKIKSIPVLF